MKALFINPGGIGDQILLLPTIKLLKEKLPLLDIELITEPRSKAIEELTNLYSKVLEFDFKNKNPDILYLLSLIRKHNYKYLFSTGASYKANLITSAGKAEYKIGFNKGILSNLLLTHSINLNSKQYTGNMFAELLSPIIENIHDITSKQQLIPEIQIKKEAAQWAKELVYTRIQDKYYAKKIFIHPGVSKLSIEKNILKGWAPKHWAKLIEKLVEDENKIIFLVGGKDDEEAIRNIHNNLTYFAKPKNLFDLSKQNFNLARLAALISFSDLLICTDSAPMHIAVALNKKLVAFFGPTDPSKLLPSNSKFIPVHALNLDCRPCLFDARKESCSKPVCLEVTPEIMLEAVKKQIKL